MYVCMYVCICRCGLIGELTTPGRWLSCQWLATSWDWVTGTLSVSLSPSLSHSLSLSLQTPIQPDVGPTDWQNPAHRLWRLFRGCHDEGKVSREDSVPSHSHAHQCHGGGCGLWAGLVDWIPRWCCLTVYTCPYLAQIMKANNCIFCRHVVKRNYKPTIPNTLTIVGGWNSNIISPLWN